MAISTYKSELEVPVPVDQLFSWHENPGAFERLTPPFEPVKVKKRKGGIDGGEVHLQMKIGPSLFRGSLGIMTTLRINSSLMNKLVAFCSMESCSSI